MVVASGDVRLPRFRRREAGAEVDRLYRRYAGEVLRYAMLVLRSRADAEDITQTVFLRALRAIERGDKVRTPRNWLIKITHNECRRLLATRKVHIELPDEIAVEPVEQGRAEELRLAMTALSATQRQALVLRELEGRPYAEIARTLDVSVSAVETLIFRARRALREQIENAMSCEEFAALLNDPKARTRVRAHARVCAECARLDHRSRGRKSALKRIASVLGFPGWGTWWGAKLAAVAVTTATIATTAAVAVPHDPTPPAPAPNPVPHNSQPAQTPARSSGANLFKRPAPTHTQARPAAVVPKKQKVSDTAPVAAGAVVAPPASAAAATAPVAATPATPAAAPPTAPEAATPAPSAPDKPHPDKPHPDKPLPPAAAVPHPAVPVGPPAGVPGPPVTVPPVSVPGPPVAVPPVAVPAVPVPQTVHPPTPGPPSVPVATPGPPTVTPPVGPPNVRLP
jgi:RNA polymerase sigma factor (sigma-70 family)